jgi:hypothetical protein
MDRKVETIRMKYVLSIYIKYVNESERERNYTVGGYRGEGERKRQEEREKEREREKEKERERGMLEGQREAVTEIQMIYLKF